MKKIISLLIVLILAMGLNTVVFADTPQHSTGNFYVISEEVPQEVYTHIKKSIPAILNDIYASDELRVSNPFKVLNSYWELYYSLIYNSEKIIGIYRTFEVEGHYTGIYSDNSEIINGLMQISSCTANDKPAKIIAGKYDDLYALIGNDIYTIFSDPAGNKTEVEMIEDFSDFAESRYVIDLTEEMIINRTSASASSNPSYKYLQIGWAETQGSQPWCMAYVTASIMRYKTGNGINTISAQKVMEWAYPNLSQTDLNSTSLSTTKADQYANTYSIDPVYSASRRSYSQIVSEIVADNPVAFLCDNLNTGTKKSHAFVCRGYNDNNGTPFYSVWNPWYTNFERIYTSDNTYVTNSGNTRYLWSATMYSWE